MMTLDEMIKEHVQDHSLFMHRFKDFEKSILTFRKGDYSAQLRIERVLYLMRFDLELHLHKEEYTLFSILRHGLIPSLEIEHAYLRQGLMDLELSFEGLKEGQLSYLEDLRIQGERFRHLIELHVDKEENLFFNSLKGNIHAPDLQRIEEKIAEFDDKVAQSVGL